jgi:hypothetical protein
MDSQSTNKPTESRGEADPRAGFQPSTTQGGTSSSEESTPDSSGGRSLRRAAYLTAAVGIAHALLFILAYLLLQGTPGAKASDAELVQFYTVGDRRRLIIVGLYLMPFAAIAFLWFIVALRMWIAYSAIRVSVLLSNVQLVAGIIYIALFLTAAAALSAMSASIEFAESGVDASEARQFLQFSNTMVLVLAMRMAAIFVFTTSNIGRTSGVLPRWFIYAGFAVGLFLLLSASFSPLLVMAFPVWLLTLGAILLGRARRIPRDAVLPPRGVPAEPIARGEI